MSNKNNNDSQSNWEVDALHSELNFQVQHLMISTLTGQLKTFKVNVQTEGNDFGQVTNLQVIADISSLSTDHSPRDEHLKSKDFFDADLHPQLKFESIIFEKQGMDQRSPLSANRRDYKLRGKLTIKGVSKLVLLEGEFGGLSIGLDEKKRAGFTVRGTISREEFGLTWKGLNTAGKLIVSDEVNILGNLQLIKMPH